MPLWPAVWPQQWAPCESSRSDHPPVTAGTVCYRWLALRVATRSGLLQSGLRSTCSLFPGGNHQSVIGPAAKASSQILPWSECNGSDSQRRGHFYPLSYLHQHAKPPALWELRGRLPYHTQGFELLLTLIRAVWLNPTQLSNCRG